jgi:ubiquinone/menaquinone biosynthesis C-methylase UbiE
MDDKTFDQKTAADWIEIVESEIGRVRNADIYPLLNTWVNSVAPYEILEIGAGQGICSENIDLNGRNYIGVDPSPFLIERANELYCHPNRRFLRGTVYDLPFSASAFDAAFSIAVWHLLERLQTATSELSRVLKDNGHFLITPQIPEPILHGRGFIEIRN